MKILITGATGFLGGNLLRMLAENPANELFYLSRKGRPAHAAKDLLGVNCLEGDVTEYETLVKASKGMDVIYHAAAMVSSVKEYREKMEITNVTGTSNILHAALVNKVKKFIHISTVDAIGLEPDGSTATEKTAFNFDTLKNPYVDTKRAAELSVQEAVEKGLDAVIVNPTFMIGAYDIKGSSSRMVYEIMQGHGKLTAKGGNSFVDVLDVCRGAILAAEKGKTGERYILGGHNLSYKEFFTIVAQICGVPKPFLVLPNYLTTRLAIFFEKWARIVNKRPLLSYNDAVFSILPHYYSSQKAMQDLGYTISPIEPAVERARDWFSTIKRNKSKRKK